MSTLHHNGFQGSVEYSDGQLIIQILHIDDVVITQVENAACAQSAFEALVDDYVETCKQVGKEPSKPFKGTFNVRIPPELHKQVAMAAEDAGDSMNAWIAAALSARVARQRDRKRFNRSFLRAFQSEPDQDGYKRVEMVQMREANVVRLDRWTMSRAKAAAS